MIAVQKKDIYADYQPLIDANSNFCIEKYHSIILGLYTSTQSPTNQQVKGNDTFPVILQKSITKVSSKYHCQSAHLNIPHGVGNETPHKGD